MKLLEVKTLPIDAVKVIKFARFCDARGFFTEHYRRSDFLNHSDMSFIKDAQFVQCNESYSNKGTVRGLHFQWNPYMGKLVRTVSGRMVDMVLDIRKGSPTFGKAIFCDMPADRQADSSAWIWVPPGFAHGNFFTEDTFIEYFCSGEYSPGCEACISPLAGDIDWSLCDSALKKEFEHIAAKTNLITDKDRNGYQVGVWEKDPRSGNFIYGQM
jgi:dTDP-4-dehydrorhamnose 3,5-epimerase